MKNPMINSCAGWAKKLADTRLRELSPSEQTALLAHLEKCPACAAIRLEYQLMDTRIRSYPAKERPLHWSPPSVMPEYEFHRLRLLLRRQAERNHGIIFIVVGILFFLLVLLFFLSVSLHYQSGFLLTLVDIAGSFIPMYFLWKGMASIIANLRPVTIAEVKQQRHEARRTWYLQAHGERQPDRRFRKTLRAFLIESCLTISAGVILLLHIVDKMPAPGWAYFVAPVVLCLIECLLILDIRYYPPKHTRDLPFQSAQELSQRLIDGETTTGEEPWQPV